MWKKWVFIFPFIFQIFVLFSFLVFGFGLVCFLLYDSSDSQVGLDPKRFYQEGLWAAYFKLNKNNKIQLFK